MQGNEIAIILVNFTIVMENHFFFNFLFLIKEKFTQVRKQLKVIRMI